MIKLVFILTLIGNLSRPIVYNKPNHRIITQLAIDYLNQEFEGITISKAEAKKIIRGNLSEDRIGHKLFIRLFNQHFYNPTKKERVRRRSKSIDVRFNRISKRCFNRVNSKRYFYYVGEIVHHIQDVTNPAHVVPIYHFIVPKDQFDNQKIKNKYSFSPEIDSTISYSEPYKNSILEPIALETLSSIKDEFEIRVENDGKTSTKIIDWSYFWKGSPNSWFGSYGYLGKPLKCKRIDNYLSTRIIKDDGIYIIDDKIYKDYSYQQLELAVTKTAEFIFYAKQLHNAKNLN